MESAPLSLKFVVVGGSVAGLTSGYILRRAGHEVVILEKSDGKTKAGGSLRCPPNMTRILNEFPGMEALLQSQGTQCSGYGFKRADTLERIGFMKFHDEIMTELRAHFLVVQYDDLYSHLKSLCSGAGAVIKYESRVVDIRAAGGSTTVVLEDGSALSADIVVAADGHNSIVRTIVAKDAEEDLESTHAVAGINISVPTKVIEQDPDLKSLCNYNELSIWMGSGSSVVGTLDVRRSTIFLIGTESSQKNAELDWDEIRAKKRPLPFDLSGYDPRLQKLINMGSTCYPTVHQLHVQHEAVGLDGTIVLVGDAAHSILIHGSHNSAMAIEDAATLGRLFSRISTRSQIPMLLNAYQEIRHPRTKLMQEEEYQALSELSMQFGPVSEARDAALRPSLTMSFEDFQKAGSDNALVQIWEQYLVHFAYNAAEEVDNWWSMWGNSVVGSKLAEDIKAVTIELETTVL
ncbi:hypothetical protein B0H14DRAFT_2405944 [Mycena olivaceomarginata]|nr:hypothetical protein B0H14DRAFT_2405944 [Mycena olivaceomarginata]